MNKPPLNAGRFIGQRMPRKEDARLLTGRGSYVDDIVLPGMLHAAFVRSPIARGKIKSINVFAARAMPGVWAVYTAQDFVHLNIHVLNLLTVVPPPPPKVYPLALDRVAYVGDPVAIVIAESRYVAEDAAGLVEVDYEPEEAVVTLDDAKTGRPVHPDIETNVAELAASLDDPELDMIFANAPHVVTGGIKHQRIAHSPMEPRGIVVSKQGKGELTVYMACQGPHVVMRYLSLAFGLPQTKIRVISKDVGGAFGLKVHPGREEIAVVAAGMLLGRPVKWIEDRQENLTSAFQAREQECTLQIALDADGRLLAARTEYVINNGAYPNLPDANLLAMMVMWAAYKMPRSGFKAQGLYSNTIGLTPYRGPWAIESLIRETVLDTAARKIGIDPIELRRRNLLTPPDRPYPAFMGVDIDDITPAECLEALLKTINVPAFRAEQAAARREGRYLGIGVATYVEPTAPAVFPVFATEIAQIRIEPTGKVTAVLGTHSQGHGTETTMAQIVADRLGVPFEDVSVFEDDSSRSGFGGGAGGSRQAVAGGGAAIKASERLLDKVKRLAAHLLNANPNDVRVEGGMVHVAGADAMTRSLRDIAEIAYGQPHRLPPGMEPGLEEQYRYVPAPFTFASAAHACIVEVDAETGFVHLKRWICSEDCGVVINPAVVEGQIAGGLAQGIGMVLFENMHFDAQGNPTTVTFKDYMLPTIRDIPDFEYTHIVTPAKGEGGFRGVGEGGAIIGPPTLVNAIADALAPFGVPTVFELPLTPSKILKLIER